MLSMNLDWGVKALQKTAMEWILSLTPGISAGVSRVHLRSVGQIVVWDPIAGKHAYLAGSTMARNHSPCGYALAEGSTQLFANPWRYYQEFARNTPLMAEMLVTPLYVRDHRPYGTIWLASGADGPPLTSCEAKLLEKFAAHLVAATMMVGKYDLERMGH